MISVKQMQHKVFKADRALLLILLVLQNYMPKGNRKGESTLGSCKWISIARVKCQAGADGRIAIERDRYVGSSQVIKGSYVELEFGLSSLKGTNMLDY